MITLYDCFEAIVSLILFIVCVIAVLGTIAGILWVITEFWITILVLFIISVIGSNL